MLEFMLYELYMCILQSYRYEETGSVATLPRNGRPRLTTPAEDQAIVAASAASPRNTASDIARQEGMFH